MLHLARFAAIAVLVWFYLTAKEKGEPAIKWAVIGLIGYWIAWWLVRLTLVAAMMGLFAKSPISLFMVFQIPAIVAVVATVFIRKKLLHDAEHKPS